MVEVGGQPGGRPGTEAYVGAEHAQQLGLLLLARGLLVDRGHRGAEVGEVVGGGEAGDAEARDDRPDALPGVGLPEGVEVATRSAHVPATHSA